MTFAEMNKLGHELGCKVLTHIDDKGDFLFRICYDNTCCVSEHNFLIYKFVGKTITYTSNILVKEKEPYSLDYTITEHDFRLAVTSLIIATKEYQEYRKLKQANEDFE
jgi:hypothetical protein